MNLFSMKSGFAKTLGVYGRSVSDYFSFKPEMVEPAPGESRQEQRRVFDPTIVPDDDPDLIEEFATDSLQPIISGEIEPKIKITTEPMPPDSVPPFCEALVELIPNSIYEQRDEGETLTNLISRSADEEFTTILLITSGDGLVNSMYQIVLPSGPCVCWRVTTIVYKKDIPGHARTSHHYPEVILKRFETVLGKRCGRLLRTLFPAKPQFEGRRVCTFHQQRDFIFFRHYRYQFDNPETARLQEAGPRFTLRLLWFQDGPYDPQNGQYVFFRRQRNEKSRLKWAL